MISLSDQLKCVRREIALRRSAYPQFIRRGTLTQEQASREIAAMEAVLTTLQAIHDRKQTEGS